MGFHIGIIDAEDWFLRQLEIWWPTVCGTPCFFAWDLASHSNFWIFSCYCTIIATYGLPRAKILKPIPMAILLPSEGEDWLPALLGEWHYLAGTSNNQLCLWCLAFKLLEIVGKEGLTEDFWMRFGHIVFPSSWFVVWLAGWRLWIPLWIALVLCFLL